MRPDRELATIIDEDLDRLQALVTDAVQMVRIDAGDFVLHRDRHVVADIVSATLRQFEAHLDGHPHHRTASRPACRSTPIASCSVWRCGSCSTTRVKYSPPTSTIEIAAIGNGAVDIGVRNTGPAIPEREQARIFERFYRGAQARHIPGTGMGLAIVQQIARAHGGSLTVSSTAEAGTAFTLSLPRGRDHLMSAGRILVVDDDPQIRRVMRVTLTGQGYEVDDAKNGESALEKLREQRFDLVLLDMNMPGMGGLETCRAIRAPLRRSPSSC